jgi:hypothetical protein
MQAQTHYTLQVGSGTATNAYVPDYGYYNYSYTQSLYTAGEVGLDGVIDTLAFQVDNGSLTRTLSIYMAEVSSTSFSSTSDAVGVANFHLVYTGSVSWSAGWVNIALDSTFDYQDTGSLVIAVIDQTGSYQSGYPYFAGTSMSNSRSLYAYNDNNAYSLSSSLTSSTSFLPNIRLGILSFSSYCAMPGDVVVSGIMDDEATITWHENGTATAWELIVSDEPVTDFSSASTITVTDTTYTVTGLSSNAPYYVYVRAICDATSSSGWTNANTFRSACMGSTTVPYSTGFEDITTGQLPNCWWQVQSGSSSASTFPAAYDYASNARNGNVYFEFESNSGETEVAALPEMDNINTLQITFYASVMNANFRFEVGVMEDSLFVPVDTVELTTGSGNNWHNSYNPYTVSFANYEGNGNRIAMRVTPYGNNYTLMMDDFVVEEIPSCLPPSNFVMDSIGHTWAGLSWHDNAEANEWEVMFDSMAFNPNTTTTLIPVSVFDTNVVITGLTSGMTYYAYVRANCGDYSPWVGPMTFTTGQYIMRYSGSDTVRTCGLAIYDDGGADNEYTTGADFTLVVYPSSDDSVVTFWGSADLYGYYARLRIYEGVGTNGMPIWQSNSSDYYYTIPFTRSNAGAITIRFTGGSYNYGYQGFELFTGCEEAPQCAVINNLAAASVGTGSAIMTWGIAGSQFGMPQSYELECVDTATTTTTTLTTTTTNATITGLTANTTYKVRVRPECEGNAYGDWDSIYITTLHLPCMQYDTSIADSITIVGNVPTTSYQLPINTFYNYTYSQQLIDRDEMTGGTIISGIDFDYGYSSSNSTKTNCTIYLANTNATSLSDNFVPFDSTFVQVYSGSMVCNMGWNHFEFDTPFTYDGASNLLVTVLDNSGAYNSSTYVFNCHSISGHSRHLYQDSGPYNPTNVPSGYVGTMRSNMRLHIAGCSELMTCGRPIASVDSIGTDIINLSWAPGYQETSWDVEYRAEGDTVWTSAGTTTNTFYNFSMLTPDTRYYIHITANCTDTMMTTELSVRTICIPEPLPFSYGFETYGGSAPACWHAASTYSYGTYPTPDSYRAHSGSMSLNMYSSSDSYTYLALPVMAAPLDSLELSFWFYKSDSYDPHELAVGVMSDPENFNTFVPIATVSATQPAVWEPKHILFTNYTGNGAHIAFATMEDAYSSPYIDDIVIDYVRPCPRISNVAATNITTSDATIVWNMAGNENFELEWGPAGFVHDSGTVVPCTADSVLISGLTPNSSYDVYVRTFCSSGDTSVWSDVYTFRTNCITIDSLPFAEGFETVPAGWGDYNSVDFYPCWSRPINPASSSFYPYVYSYSSHTGNNGLYWYWSNYDNIDYYLIMPAIDTIAVPFSDLQLNFWASNNGSTYADVPTYQIGVMTDPNVLSTFQVVDTVEVISEDWTLYEIPLNNYHGNGSYIAIRTVPTYVNGYWYAYMDDISLGHIPSCVHVYDLAVTGNTANSIDLDWTETGSATTWEIAIDTVETAIPVADTTVMDSSFATIGGLTSGTRYYFWVRGICGAGDTADWEGPVMGIPNTWIMRANQTDTLVYCGGTIFDNGGPNGSYSNSQNSTIILMPDDSNSLVSVSGSSYTESTYDYITIYDGIGTGGTQLWSDYGISTLTSFGPFTSTTGPLTVTFHSDGSVNYDGFEISVSCISSYCRVSGVGLNPAVAQSPTQLALTWNDNGANLYEVEYDTTGFTQGNGTVLTTTTNSIVIPGLSTLGVYDVYVRSICGMGDTGAWTPVYHFQTAFCNGLTEAQSWAGSTSSASTTSYGPIGYSCYNYSYVQVIIDSAALSDLSGDIIAFGFKPENANSGNYGSYFTNMDIYMANVSESSFTNFILPDSNHQFVQVMSNGNCNYSTNDWQTIALDTAFVWDGHSNVLVAFNRGHGSYSCSANFSCHDVSGYKMVYAYNDNNPYTITNPSAASSYSYTTSTVGDLRLYSCNASACPQPVITSVSQTYESATITWTGDGNDYEVNIKEATATDWPATDIHVTGNTYTFTSLQPSTNYTFRVRQDCNADSMGYSEWVMGNVLTDSLPCLAPDSLHVTAVTNATATFDWAPLGTESAWDIHVWYSGGIDSVYTVSTRPATIGGFTPGVTYQATIRPLCGSAHNIVGDWGDTISFTTAVCPNVTGLTSSDLHPNSVTLTWTADPMAEQWIIEYGYRGFDQGTGTTITTTLNTYTINGLVDDMQYDFLVRAVCGTDWQSESWASITVTTPEGGVPCEAPTNVSAVVAGNSATISWTANTGNLSYTLEYGPRGFAHGSGITVNATSSPITLSNLDYDTDYDVYVQGVCDQSTLSAWSTVCSFTTEAQGSEECDPVTDLNASNVTENSALLTWTPGATGDEWEVVVTTATGTTVSEASTTEHQYALSGLTPGTGYVAKVRTVCGDGVYSTFASTSFSTLTVGIDGVAEPACTIYPNPTSSTTTITVAGVSGKVKIAVIDLHGSELATTTLDCTGDCTKSFDVDRLAQGAYFVRITGENVSMVRKLIVR